MREKIIDLLEDRGVTIQDIVDIVKELQAPYIANIEAMTDRITEMVKEVLNKREVQHAVMTGIFIDVATEEDEVPDFELSQIIAEDKGLYGIDEVLAYGICNIYGSIALTNFGYVDKLKPGIIGELNDPRPGVCNTFLDDIVGAIAASAAAKLAHSI